MPTSLSGVMLVVWIRPSGVAMARPPAKGLLSGVLWQATQSLSRATYSPRWSSSGVAATAGALSKGEDGVRNAIQATAMARTMRTRRMTLSAFLKGVRSIEGDQRTRAPVFYIGA